MSQQPILKSSFPVRVHASLSSLVRNYTHTDLDNKSMELQDVEGLQSCWHSKSNEDVTKGLKLAKSIGKK